MVGIVYVEGSRDNMILLPGEYRVAVQLLRRKHVRQATFVRLLLRSRPY